MAVRVTAEQLELAATWLESYEAAPDDENGDALADVSLWIRAEVARRR